MLQPNCMSEDWEILQKFFPNDWKELAATSGASKGLRQDKDPATLLRVILLHVGCGYSLRETSARAKASGLCDLSDVSVLKRLNKSKTWLHALCAALFGEVVISPDKLDALGKLRLVDGSLISEPGKTGSTWRLHYSMARPSLLCDHFELTPAKGKGTGEALDCYPVSKGDHLLADRGFCNARAIHAVCALGAEVTVRLNPSNIRIFTPHSPEMAATASPREIFDLKGFLEQWDAGWEAKSQEVTLADGQNGSMVRGRICAVRKSEEAIATALNKLTRRAQKNGEKLKEETKLHARYVMIFTTIPEDVLGPAEAMNLYLLRWQVELVFKRFKQMIDLGHLPKNDPQSSRSWLYGKMFSALLTEKLVATTERFSPWGYDIKATEKSLA